MHPNGKGSLRALKFLLQRNLRLLESVGRAASYGLLRSVTPIIHRILKRMRIAASIKVANSEDPERLFAQMRIPLLRELIEVSKTELAGLSANGWVTTVAGIEVLEGDRFLVVARESNAIWTPHAFRRHRILSGSKPTSRLRAVCLERKGDSFLVTKNVLLAESENRYDPRLFWTRKGLQVLVTTLAPPASLRTWIMATATLDPKNMKLSAFTQLESDRCRDSEKNWMPISQQSENKSYYVYSVGPTQIIEGSPKHKLTWLVSGGTPQSLVSARGGSQLVEFSEGVYFSIVHHTKFWPLRHYSHRFVVFRRDEKRAFRVSSFSREFYLDGVHRLEVATGLAITGRHALVTFGQDERKTFILKIETHEMESLAQEFSEVASISPRNLKMSR